jgi:amino acid permease
MKVVFFAFLLVVHCKGLATLRNTRLTTKLAPLKARETSSSGVNTAVVAAAKSSSSTTVFSQAALIAGTTIGGGFLALPSVTAPCGAKPAVIGLAATWIYLLGCALSLSNTIFMLHSSREGGGDENDDCKELSMLSVARVCFGSLAGYVVSFLFLVLVEATLVAQLSKMGHLLQAVAGGRRALATLAFSTALVLTCMLCSPRRVERINDAMTGTMLAAFAALMVLCKSSGQWTREGLRRVDYLSLVPPRLMTAAAATTTTTTAAAAAATTTATTAATTAPWALPVFIQLLIYAEVVPLVSSRLRDERKVARAVVWGSAVPLLMCIAWTLIALGLVPYVPPLPLTSATAAGGGGIYDPLERLRTTLGTGSGLLASVNILATSAIITTAIGSIVATTQLLQDLVSTLFPDGSAGSSKKGGGGGRLLSLFVHLLAVAPAAIVAASGSPDLYFYSTAFAGEVPCTLLYGLLPPLCNLRVRRMLESRSRSRSTKGSEGGVRRWYGGSGSGSGGGYLTLKAVFPQVMLALVSATILVGSQLK